MSIRVLRKENIISSVNIVQWLLTFEKKPILQEIIRKE